MYKFDEYICQFFFRGDKKWHIPYQKVFDRVSQVNDINNFSYLPSLG